MNFSRSRLTSTKIIFCYVSQAQIQYVSDCHGIEGNREQERDSATVDWTKCEVSETRTIIVRQRNVRMQLTNRMNLCEAPSPSFSKCHDIGWPQQQRVWLSVWSAAGNKSKNVFAIVLVLVSTSIRQPTNYHESPLLLRFTYAHTQRLLCIASRKSSPPNEKRRSNFFFSSFLLLLSTSCFICLTLFHRNGIYSRSKTRVCRCVWDLRALCNDSFLSPVHRNGVGSEIFREHRESRAETFRCVQASGWIRNGCSLLFPYKFCFFSQIRTRKKSQQNNCDREWDETSSKSAFRRQKNCFDAELQKLLLSSGTLTISGISHSMEPLSLALLIMNATFVLCVLLSRRYLTLL